LGSKANIDIKALNRAIKSLKLQIIKQETDFSENCQIAEQHQKLWVTTAEKLTEQYREERAKNIKLVTQAKQMGILDVHGMPSSNQLTEDLRSEGIACIEKVP
jgi:hypothetical protein